MKLVDKKISIGELKQMSVRMFGGLVKAVVDIHKQVMVVDAEMHADEEAYLLKEGSKQDDLWGINLYPDATGEDWLEFDSMINLRPSFGNRSRGVDDPDTRARIADLVNQLVKR